MAIGDRLASEVVGWADPETGRKIRQVTSSRSNNYPLYYFIPTTTVDGRFLVFHSERSGWVQLYRMEIATGEIVQLTDGTTRDSGWAIWCEYHVRGIFNHISALNVVRSEVYYFQDNELRATDLLTLENRLVAKLGRRISIGQTSFSPDGKRFAFIHADHDQFRTAVADREALANMGREIDHQAWRNALPTTISVVDTSTGEMRTVVELDYHVHHVLWIDDQTLLVNHPRNDMGMWTIGIDGSGYHHLRPRDEHGAVCHQIITRRGILYDAYGADGDSWFGVYDLVTHTHREVFLPGVKYAHTGNDPAGELYFVDSRSGVEEIFTIHEPFGPARFELRRFRKLNKMLREGQRHHCHPFLSPDRKTMFWTEVIDGFSQICSTDVKDLTCR